MARTRRLRVLTLIDRPVQEGGGEQLARVIAMRLDPARFDRALCATRPVPEGTLEPIVAAGVEVLSLERGSRTALAAWWPLVSFLHRRRIDVLHTHKFGSNVWGTAIGRLAGVPVIVAHEHTWSYEGQPLRRAGDREIVARAAHAIVAVSREDRRRMIEIEHIDPRRVRFIPNAIPPRLTGSGDAIRAELGIPAEAPVIGTVGSLRPQKALQHLIECARLLVGSFPELRVVVVGEGEEEARIRALIEQRELQRTVLLLGHRTDVPDVLAALDVAVTVSDWEGSPLAVMEYMAAGRPVVATRVGGIPDLVTDDVHGLLAERGDVAGLAHAIAQLLRDPKRRAEMGDLGRRRQRDEFDIDRLVGRIELLYEELFRAGARARREGWAPP
jgi:glycosyltransferase involved in cell wall biosynthesis